VCFFAGEISPFFDKEIEKKNCFSNVNSTIVANLGSIFVNFFDNNRPTLVMAL
jgi:hypothetical protein